ncbi:MAG: NYN domain-containing protein [Lentisphaerae bacterium]|nr:NYN domain-containing protein [Lentisphaerota bacterium]
MSEDTRFGSMAVFCDFENVALGVHDAKYDMFDIRLVLEKLLLKGSILVKKAYCDWSRYREFKPGMHEAAFELIDIPHVRQSGKNSADIRLVVDALDLCYTKPHVDTFVVVSGDSDFSPLVSKLRENNKTVIGVGVKNSSSDLLVSNCDDFIYYDDLVRGKRKARAPRKAAAAPAAPKTPRGSAARAAKAEEPPRAEAPRVEPRPAPRPEGRAETGEEIEARRQEGIAIVLETAAELLNERGGREQVWGSVVKQTLKRRQPGFNEAYHGFKSFNALLEEAQTRGLLTLRHDDKSGGNVITAVKRDE